MACSQFQGTRYRSRVKSNICLSVETLGGSWRWKEDSIICTFELPGLCENIEWACFHANVQCILYPSSAWQRKFHHAGVRGYSPTWVHIPTIDNIAESIKTHQQSHKTASENQDHSRTTHCSPCFTRHGWKWLVSSIQNCLSLCGSSWTILDIVLRCLQKCKLHACRFPQKCTRSVWQVPLWNQGWPTKR